LLAPDQSGLQLGADNNQVKTDSEIDADAQTVGSLVLKALLVQQEMDLLFASLRDLGANVRLDLAAASLRSVEQVMEMLHSSKSQVYRWTKSGELRAAWLDRRPRYRPQDIQAFIDSRAKMGKPLKKTKSPVSTAAAVKHPRRPIKRTNMKKRTS
jgi:predicted DNA-binding transcriptional regulator AlpA